MISDERATTAMATSSGVASFFSDIVAVARSTRESSIPCSTFFGVMVQPGATAFTLTPPISDTSFFRDKSSPEVIAPLAVA